MKEVSKKEMAVTIAWALFNLNSVKNVSSYVVRSKIKSLLRAKKTDLLNPWINAQKVLKQKGFDLNDVSDATQDFI